MKKLVNVSVLFGIVALVLLLAVGQAGAAPPPQMGPPPGGGEKPGGWGPGPVPQGEAEVEPTDTALRIDFEVSGHKARSGLYVVRYPGGDELTSWYARYGAIDSGWINVEITRKTVWVEVIYYPASHGAPITMKILNHAPDTAYGWVSQGMAHAIEVAWPDMPVKSADSMMPMRPDGMPWGPEGRVGGSYSMMAGSPGGMMAGMPGGPMQGSPGGMPGGPGGVPGGPGGMPGKPGS